MQKGGGRECSRSPRRMDKSTPTSTQSSSIPFMIHAYRISREHRVISLDRASSQSLSEQVTRQWAAPSHHGVLDLHIVNFPPNDLDTTADATYIVEFAPDRQRQADPADRLILVDIKILYISARGRWEYWRPAAANMYSLADMIYLSVIHVFGISPVQLFSGQMTYTLSPDLKQTRGQPGERKTHPRTRNLGKSLDLAVKRCVCVCVSL